MPIRSAAAVLSTMAISVLFGSRASAQDAPLVAPTTLLVPNDDSLPIGTWPAFEANAAVVRTDDSAAVWFNPAGLAKAGSSSAAASASTVVSTKVTSDGFASDVAGSQLTPSQFAAVLTSLREKSGWTLGFGITRLVSWDVRADGLLFQDLAAGRRRLTFNENGSYVRTSYAAAGARSLSESLRAGLAISLESVETTALVAGTDAVASASSRAYTWREDLENQTLLLRATLGVQADLGGGWGVGAVVRGPGVAVSSSGRYSGDFTLVAATGTTNVSFFDDDAKGEAKLPWEVAGGLAWAGSRLSVEAKVRYLSSVGSYELFATDQPATVTMTGGGSGPVSLQIPVPSVRTSREAVTDLALGGHVDLGASKKVRLHAGVGTSNSPVPAGDEVYTRANLWSATLGASTKVSSLRFSVGVRWEQGKVDEVRAEVLPIGEVVRSGADIRNFGVVFAFAYDPGAAP